MIIVQNGRLFQTWTSIAIDSASQTAPNTLHGDQRVLGGGLIGSARGSAMVDTASVPPSRSRNRNAAAVPPQRYSLVLPATSLMRAINSSAAFSTGTFSLTTRF